MREAEQKRRAHLEGWSAGSNSRTEEEEVRDQGKGHWQGEQRSLFKDNPRLEDRQGSTISTECGSDGQVTRGANRDQKWMLLLIKITP